MNVEQELISILLNRPQDKFIANVNADWFININLRWAYEAISKLDTDDVTPLDVYGRVMQGHPDSSLQLNELNVLKRNFVTDANVEGLTVKLHQAHLSRVLDLQIAQYQQAKTDENRQMVRETLNLIDRLQVVRDDGSLENTFAELADGMEHERPTGIRTLDSLDKILGGGLYGGMLLTIGARPAVGKTAFSLNLAYEIVHNDPGVQVDYFTLEMNKRELANRLISVDTGISSWKLKNPYRLDSTQKMRIKESMDAYRGLNIRVFDRTPNLGDILATIRRNASKTERNKYVAMIDYIGLINVAGDLPRYMQVSEITRELKVAANEYDIPIVELSQLNRGIESRMDKRPTLSDLRESGSVEQDSNVVGFLYKPNEEEAPQIERLAIEKNRDGVTGDLYFNFIGSEMKFQEINKKAIE